MAKRDPEKTARNKEIAEMTVQLKALLPRVLAITGISSELSLHGIYGGKHAQFIDIKHAVIQTPEHFVTLWLRGYMSFLKKYGAIMGATGHYKNFCFIRDHAEVRDYIFLFLKRTFLREYDALAKKRPTVEQSTLWIGHNRASYGLLVTPRFQAGEWENDKSEIRHFEQDYWTIGHVLETGLVIPSKDAKITFLSVEQYLAFFEHTLVRASASPHEAAIAERYCNFVRNAPDPSKVPLLIPELRYAGLDGNHQYRLDFCVIDPFTMERVGFELSPWSTHGQLTGLKGLTQQKINDLAKANFEAEMKKLRAFLKKHEIYTLVYTDEDFQNYAMLFEDMARYLVPQKAAKQLELRILDEMANFTA